MRRGRMRLEVSGGFWLLVAWLNYLDGQGLVPLALLACGLHELGHWFVLSLLGAEVRAVRLTAVGAEMEAARALSYGGEMLATLAGPGVNLALALVFCRLPGGQAFAGLNLVLACFNLLPVGRLDGGRTLRCLLSWLWGPGAALRAGRWLDRALTGGLVLFGALSTCLGGGVTLLLTAGWLFSGLEWEKTGKRTCHPGRKRVKWAYRM